ncbi:MAG: porin family protein [Pseudomonadota bacterium]
MRDRRSVLPYSVLIIIAFATQAPSATADGGEGPYFGLRAGGATVEDSEADGIDIEYDTSFAISGLVGYQFRGFRLEGEFGYQGLEGLSETDVNSDVDVGRFTLNGYLDLPVAPNLGPYVGGGFGVASLTADDDFEDEDSAFTWHAEAGLNVGVTDQFILSPFYRYQWIDTDLGQQSEPLVSHLFGVSLRYVLTWQGQRVANRGYSPTRYDGYSSYGDHHRYRGYDRYDRYDHHHHDRYRKRKTRSPEQQERDRCGWKGPGCDEEEQEDWRG